jgi:hypothetical protein
LARYDELGRAERDALLRHAYECAECRGRLVAADPARAFALLAVRPLPEGTLATVSDGVRRRIAPPAAAGRRAGLAWGAIAASLLLAAALSGLGGLRPSGTARRTAGPSFEGARAAGLARERGREPGAVEVLSPAGAEVYDLSVGEARIVMIFDADIDI